MIIIILTMLILTMLILHHGCIDDAKTHAHWFN